jgi:hypothetical protein
MDVQRVKRRHGPGVDAISPDVEGTVPDFAIVWWCSRINNVGRWTATTSASGSVMIRQATTGRIPGEIVFH